MKRRVPARARWISAATLVLYSVLAPAAWTVVHDTQDYIAYADPDTVSRQGDMVQMRDLIDLKVPRSSPLGTHHASSTAHSEFDCRNERVRTLRFALHSGQMGGGDIVETPSVAAYWLPLSAGSLLQVLWHFACRR